jgi:hypothetical protein
MPCQAPTHTTTLQHELILNVQRPATHCTLPPTHPPKPPKMYKAIADSRAGAQVRQTHCPLCNHQHVR